MGLFDFFWRLFGGGTPASGPATVSAPAERPTVKPRRQKRAKPRLVPLRRQSHNVRQARASVAVSAQPPYRFARMSVNSSASGERVGFCDLSQDADAERLARFGLPMLRTPEDVAQWLGVPVGTLAWLTHRCDEANRPASPRTSHYHYSWVRKVSGGWRLIEAPKRRLRDAQEQILREILDRVPPHSAAHGVVTGRSIISNAEPHAGQRVVGSFD